MNEYKSQLIETGLSERDAEISCLHLNKMRQGIN
jgi:hypothetical protein